MQKLSWDTPTMAELFLQQGNRARAIAIYRQVVKDHPEQQESQRRLQELEQQYKNEREQSLSFREHLQRIVEGVPGCHACTLIGTDGIAVDTFEMGGGAVDSMALLVEFAAAFNQQFRNDALQSRIGTVSEYVLASDRATVVFRRVNDDYILAALLAPTALLGKARYLLRVVAPKLLDHLK